jgi:hypothetical protein
MIASVSSIKFEWFEAAKDIFFMNYFPLQLDNVFPEPVKEMAIFLGINYHDV